MTATKSCEKTGVQNVACTFGQFVHVTVSGLFKTETCTKKQKKYNENLNTNSGEWSNSVIPPLSGHSHLGLMVPLISYPVCIQVNWRHLWWFTAAQIIYTSALPPPPSLWFLASFQMRMSSRTITKVAFFIFDQSKDQWFLTKCHDFNVSHKFWKTYKNLWPVYKKLLLKYWAVSCIIEL